MRTYDLTNKVNSQTKKLPFFISEGLKTMEMVNCFIYNNDPQHEDSTAENDVKVVIEFKNGWWIFNASTFTCYRTHKEYGCDSLQAIHNLFLTAETRLLHADKNITGKVFEITDTVIVSIKPTLVNTPVQYLIEVLNIQDELTAANFLSYFVDVKEKRMVEPVLKEIKKSDVCYFISY